MNVITILCDTLRRDHLGAYHRGRSLNRCWSAEQPDWVVPTPNMDRLAARGTVFDDCWCGSTPCMPARRDVYTGRYDFLWRGWAPLEEDDADLPRAVSGPNPNRSVATTVAEGGRVSCLISDHFHLWEKGAGNYHMGYTGHHFVRGIEGDAWHTDPAQDYFCPPLDRGGTNERHWLNAHLTGRTREEQWTAPQLFATAADWVRRNRAHRDFYLHLDCFPPHEPFDPPEDILRLFWPTGYDVPFAWGGHAPYARIADSGLTSEQVRFAQARYAANVVLVDRWLGRLLDALDETGLWDDTLVILTTDHGTYNGDHGRTGKLQTHQHDAVGHIPLILAHPTLGHGERRDQLVQLVDLYPTTLAAVGRPCPPGRHGVDLLPVLADAAQPTRPVAVSGQFGRSITITDGDWILHQSPPDPQDNQPLNWYSPYEAKFLPYDLGPFDGVRRACRSPSWSTPTWLSDRHADPNELVNLADREPAQLARMQTLLRAELQRLGAPEEQAVRLGLV